jgi:hypothetical protein
MTTTIADLRSAGVRAKHRPAFPARDLVQAVRQLRRVDQMLVSSPKFRFGFLVANLAECHEITQPVSRDVAVEKDERPFVVNVKARDVAAFPALSAVTLQRGPSLRAPVRASVMLMPAAPPVVERPGHEGPHEISSALKTAEVPRLDGAGVFEDDFFALMADYRNAARLPARSCSLPEPVTRLPAEVSAGPFGDIGLGVVISAALLAG